MKQIIVGIYRIYREGSRILAHDKTCYDKGCKYHAANLSRREFQSILAKRKKFIRYYSGDKKFISYGKNSLTIGCTKVPYSTLNRIARLFDK